MSEHQRVNLEPAMVLHSRPYRNSSLIVECFTRHHGRVTVVARSARGPKSRYRGCLQPFMPLLISWVGRSELKTLGNAELQGLGISLTGTVLLCGFYLNELLMRLLGKGDPYPDLYDQYVDTLKQFSQGGLVEAQLRYFECDLLQSLGYGLSLNYSLTADCAIDSRAYYRYVPEQGFLQTEQIDDINALSGEVLLALAQKTLQTPKQLKAAKYLMRLVLSGYLGRKPIHSRELF